MKNALKVLFLSTFANFPFSWKDNSLKNIPKFNGLDTFVKEFTVGETPGASGDTYTITIDPDLKDFVPFSVAAFTQAVPSVRQTTLGITSHDQTTGVTVLTASGVLAAGSRVSVLYVRAS